MNPLIKKYTYSILFFSLLMGMTFLWSCSSTGNQAVQQPALISNPFIPGYFADPSIVEHEGTYYVFATIDPWGGDSLAVFASSDFKSWERIQLNWPTLKQCQTPESSSARVWAPGVIKGLDNKYHLFVSVGSEIYAGISDHPAGPWKNVNAEGTPLIATQKEIGVHTIDAEAFIDDDGQAYLYWGSGLTWESPSYCMIARLDSSMTQLTSEPKDITPPNYFEAPYLYKKGGKYYLMYSKGKCIDRTYQIHVAVGDTPEGPWTEIESSPVLTTTEDSTTLGPGHHTLLEYGGQAYILYHRVDNNDNTLLRELVIDSLNFDEKGDMLPVKPGVGVAHFIQ